MPDDEWGILRDRITDRAQGKPTGLEARCLWCGDRVFIRSKKRGDRYLPLFVHYGGGGTNCPWHSGKTTAPSEIRATQYHGNQKSLAHIVLCEQIEQLAKQDSRYVRSSIEEYLPPTENGFGRYPDVYLEWKGFRPFSFEVQLSNTFQTEISARSIHYEREGVSLIWIFYGIDPRTDDIPQSFRDVIRRHRGNAFTLDRYSIRASRENKTLMLTCYMKNAEESFDDPILVRLDKLIFPNENGLCYHEDRITKALKHRINERRKPWFDLFNVLEPGWDERSTAHPEAIETFSKLGEAVSTLSYWDTFEESKFAVLRLISIVFSILAFANGKERNYTTRHPNIRAMLNTLLHTSTATQRYAELLRELISSTRAHGLLNGSVGQHIERAMKAVEGNLCLRDEPEWRIMSYLIPEVFDPLMREELLYLGALPAWASSKGED
ncbi:hypothetical protein [Parvibaculum sp.]|uniref:competence protein CoiA family protein n=1 Tax=Parvibaculum sp. TaxID=2024848 RepID=UPI00320E214B